MLRNLGGIFSRSILLTFWFFSFHENINKKFYASFVERISKKFRSEKNGSCDENSKKIGWSCVYALDEVWFALER